VPAGAGRAAPGASRVRAGVVQLLWWKALQDPSESESSLISSESAANDRTRRFRAYAFRSGRRPVYIAVMNGRCTRPAKSWSASREIWCRMRRWPSAGSRRILTGAPDGPGS